MNKVIYLCNFFLCSIFLSPLFSVCMIIKGGVEIPIEQAPYQASIFNIKNRIISCGGSIISENFILTAAHCCTLPAEDYSVRVGSIYWYREEFIHNVTKVIPHADYHQETYLNDICLMKVSPPFKIDDKKIKIINLFDKGQTFTPSTSAFLTGWGTQSMDGDVSEKLMGLTVKMMSTETCNSSYNDYTHQLVANQICASVPWTTNDFCNGDSGSPLVIKTQQVGIVSWSGGPECFTRNHPGVYVEVSAYRDWITQNMI